MRSDHARHVDGDRTQRTSVHEVGGTDDDLLRRCRAGDEVAWDELVSRYESLIFARALGGGLDRADAADVTQATFVALLEVGLELRDGERLSSWLMTVAHRQVWRARRQASRDSTVELPLQPVTTIEEWEQVSVLQDALVRLGSPCHDLLAALYLDPSRPTYQAVASRFGVALGSVGPKRARCLAKLRELMDESGIS